MALCLAGMIQLDITNFQSMLEGNHVRATDLNIFLLLLLFESGWRIVLISCYITGIATFYLSCAIITLNVSWKHTKPTYTFRFYQIVRLKLWYQVFFLFPLDFSYFSMMTASTNRSIFVYSRLRRRKILKFTIKRNNLQ